MGTGALPGTIQQRRLLERAPKLHGAAVQLMQRMTVNLRNARMQDASSGGRPMRQPSPS